MTARNRNRTVSFLNGTPVWLGSGSVGPTVPALTSTETCADVIGNFAGENPFNLVKTRNHLYFVKGESHPPIVSNRWKYNNFSPAVATLTHGGPSSSEPSDNVSAIKALALTNPSRPVLDLPVSLFELRDIPRMIQHYLEQSNKILNGIKILLADRGLGQDSKWDITQINWKAIPKEIAQEHLNREYGLKPMISDVMKMMQFVNSVDKRVHTLKRLASGDSVGRVATVWEDTFQAPTSSHPLTGLYQESNSVSYNVLTTRKKWVSVKYKALLPLPDTDAELRDLANRIVFGTQDLSLSTLWNAMPWTWLADWFGNIGDVLAATRNPLQLDHTRCCIMLETNTKLTNLRVSGPGSPYCEILPVDSNKITKIRRLAPLLLLPEFGIPLLDFRQLSILSAISVTKVRPIMG